MKKRLAPVLAAAVMMFAALTAFGDVYVDVVNNGETIEFDSRPVIANDRTMVPVRFVTERLGAEVGWDGENREVLIKHFGDTMVLEIGRSYADINGKAVALDSPPFIKEDRTMVPLRFISENFGANVSWDQETYTAYIQRNLVTMRTEPESPAAGKNFYLIIEGIDAWNIYGYQIDMTVDTEAFEIIETADPGYIDGMMFRNEHSKEDGTISFIKTMTGKKEGQSGRGELLRIELKAKTPGEHSLEIGKLETVDDTAAKTAVKTIPLELDIQE